MAKRRRLIRGLTSVPLDQSIPSSTIGGVMKVAIFAFCALISVGVIASEAGGDEGHVGEEGHHKHTLAVFAGITREDSENWLRVRVQRRLGALTAG